MHSAPPKKFAIILAISIFIAPFFLFSSNKKVWKRISPSSLLWIQEIIYPFEALWSESSSHVKSLWESYLHLVRAKEENKELKKKLQLLETKLLDYNHQRAEVTRLRSLLNFSNTVMSKTINVEVVGIIGSPPFHSLRISRGYSDGIKIGMPVISSKGVVGRIIRTGKNYSDVQRIGDHQFQIDVLIARNRIRGTLRGGTDNFCTLHLHSRADIKIGDTVTSSGISGSFPKGIPVGRVVKISYEVDNISQTITVKPWVQLSEIEELIVIKRVSHELETVLESMSKRAHQFNQN